MNSVQPSSSFLHNFGPSVRAWLGDWFSRRPVLERYREQVFPSTKAEPGALRVTFFGVSTLLFEDGETSILTDGFFTRPGKLSLLGKIGPEPELIARRLDEAEIKNLAAVIVLHSHFDHALDAPTVVEQFNTKRTGSEPTANLIGSESTGYIARGYGLAEDKIIAIAGNACFKYGRFQITLLRSGHSPVPLLTYLGINRVPFEGDITEPLQPPACLTDYKEGGSYSMLIEHDGKKMLVQASAGFEKDALFGSYADVVFLGVGMLGNLKNKYRIDYWNETVATVQAARVFPIHWDDLTLPLDQPLIPIPRPLDNFDKTMKFLLKRGSESQVEVRLLPKLARIDPFAGLEARDE